MEKGENISAKEFCIDFDQNTRTMKYYEDDDFEAYIWGVIIDSRLVGEKDYNQFQIVKEIAYQKNNFDFNYLHGAFKVCIRNLKTGEITLLSDNSGSQQFYIDIQEKQISDRFLKLVSKRNGLIEPDYQAISLFFKYGFLVTESTAVEGIETTLADSFYLIRGAELEKRDKNLTPLWEKSKYEMSLGNLMKLLTSRLDARETCAVATGGTDSRAILAHLLSFGLSPQLFISGHQSNPDIPVAEQIAKVSNCNLQVYDPDDKENDWINQGFEFSDGIYNSILSYRHLRLALMAAEGKFLYEFGGVGGEFFKNSYCRVIRDKSLFKEAADELVRNAIYKKQMPTWFGMNLRVCEPVEDASIKKIVEQNNHGKLLARCNSVGFQRLNRTFTSLTSNYARYCTKIDPLMDRSVISTISQDSPVSHYIHCWNRREISTAFPALAGIKTDRGLNCKYSLVSITRDALLDVYSRFSRKLFYSMQGDYWGKDYAESLKLSDYSNAENICKELGLIQPDYTFEKIPADKYGSIITIGKIFESRFKSNTEA